MGELLFMVALGLLFVFLLDSFNFNEFINDLKDSHVWIIAVMVGCLLLLGISAIYSLFDTGYDIASKEYELTQISENFIIYDNNGMESMIELNDTDVEVIPSDKNQVVFEEKTYDESNFINSILYTPSSTEIKIYVKVVE